MPTPLGMMLKAKQVLAVAVWTMTWWICELIPIPASGILPFILIPAMGIAPVSTVFSVLGHENNWLMIAPISLWVHSLNMALQSELQCGFFQGRWLLEAR